jgi:hypothetical protein
MFFSATGRSWISVAEYQCEYTGWKLGSCQGFMQENYIFLCSPILFRHCVVPSHKYRLWQRSFCTLVWLPDKKGIYFHTIAQQDICLCIFNCILHNNQRVKHWYFWLEEWFHSKYKSFCPKKSQHFDVSSKPKPETEFQNQHWNSCTKLEDSNAF